MEKGEQNITLSIDGQKLSMKIKPEEEFVYREAARKLNQRIDFFNNTFPKADYRLILTLVALEKAIEYESRLSQTDGLLTKIHECSEIIDRVIAEEKIPHIGCDSKILFFCSKGTAPHLSAPNRMCKSRLRTDARKQNFYTIY